MRYALSGPSTPTRALTHAPRRAQTHSSRTDHRDPLAQVATFLLLASGMPYLLTDSTLDKYRFDTPFRLRFGFDVLKWVVLILFPVFLAFGFGLTSYEIFYELSTTGGKGKRFKKLLASLAVPGARRTPGDIKNIHAAIVESEFLKSYAYSQLVTICRTCQLLELQPHEAVFSEGDIGNHFFVLIKGTLDVYVKEKAPPHAQKCVNTLHDSGSFGELALLQVRKCMRSPLHSRAQPASTMPSAVAAFHRSRACAPHRSSASHRWSSSRSTAMNSSI